jgi:hypothetical protein
MTDELYRYTFDASTPASEVETSFLLAVMSAESLHGEASVRLDAAHSFDADRRVCVIDAGTPVGRDLNKLFIGLVTREFGAGAFRVERLARDKRREAAQPQETPA